MFKKRPSFRAAISLFLVVTNGDNAIFNANQILHLLISENLIL
jgi:hypothetical protein